MCMQDILLTIVIYEVRANVVSATDGVQVSRSHIVPISFCNFSILICWLERIWLHLFVSWFGVVKVRNSQIYM